MLLERPGEVVFRDEIQRKLWPNNTIVEFDHSINAAIKRLRNALGETAEEPRYIETLAKRGYRFFGQVTKEAVEEPKAHETPRVSDTGDPDSLIGKTFSNYRVVNKLGSGGIGVVYRAEDLKLGRHVAIKVLQLPPCELPDSVLHRFEREARAASALNHPNVCTVHSVDNLGARPVIVMELVEGETLAARLGRGPLAHDEALQTGIQIASALAEAHRKGIVHRDLTPANVMLTKSGVKVLDFGLAKIDGTGRLQEQAKTKEGVIQGTLHYMSPEQARGEEVDPRSDLFSFGVVLYEMLTGKRPFNGETEPLRPATLDRLVHRCLANDVEERWESARDLRAELRWIADEPLRGQAAAMQSTRSLFSNRWQWMGAGMLTAVMIVLAVTSLREKPSQMPLVRFNVDLPDGVLFGGMPGPAFSPDGRRIVFDTLWKDSYQLWIRSLDSPVAVPLVGIEGAALPFWSPDSRSIAFFVGGKLKKMDLTGPSGYGQAITLCDSPGYGGGAWNRDGVIIFSNGSGVLYRVAETGGSTAPVTKLDEGRSERDHFYPSFLPDGSHFLFEAVAAPIPHSRNSIRIGSLDSDESKILLDADSNAIFAAGYLLFVRDSALMAQPFDSRKLAIAGDAVPVAEQMAPFAELGAFSASENGMLVYHGGAEAPPYELDWFERNGNRLSTFAEAATLPSSAVKFSTLPNSPLKISPNQGMLAATMGEHGNTDIWLYDVARGLRSRFTFDPARDVSPIWSPDGRNIVFSSDRKGHFDLYRRASDGGDQEELLYADSEDKYATSWSPDGRLLLYDAFDKEMRSSVWVLPLNAQHQGSQSKPFPFLEASSQGTKGQISPDGKWVAYQSRETGRFEIYLAPFRAQGASFGVKRQVSTAGGELPQWRRDGKEIFYRLFRSLMAVPIGAKDNAVEIGAARQVIGSLSILGYDMSSDGQRVLVEVPSRQLASHPLTVVQNWTAALRK